MAKNRHVTPAADDDRTLIIERIPFGFRKEHMLGFLLCGTMENIIQSDMGPSLTTFTAVYNCPLKAVEALHVAQAAISATEEFKTMCVRLKSDVSLRSQVELMEAKKRSREIVECERTIFVRHLSPTSTYLTVQVFFSDLGSLDGCPSVFRNPHTNEIMGVVRFTTKAVRDAVLLQLCWTKRPIELDGANIRVEPYTPRPTRHVAAAAKEDKQIEYRKSSESYEGIAKAFLGKENQHSFKNTIRLCLFNASFCQLCNLDVEDRTRSLKRIQSLDKNFEGTSECNFVSALAAALLEEDIVKFNDAVREFNNNSMAPMIAWKATTLTEILQYLMFIKELQELKDKERKT